jgi:hypothetical protein
VSARLSRVTKLKSCKWCRTLFVPQYNRVQPTCSPTCAIAFTRAKQAKEALQEAKRAKREYRRDHLTINQLKKRADREFGKFIRERDFGKPCICCDEYAKSGEWENGGLYDAGHYRTKGAADHLRYNEDNVHLQRKYCNKWKSGNQVEYRKRLVLKIGIDRVDALDNNNETKHWDREELVAIRKLYLGKWKALKAAREAA